MLRRTKQIALAAALVAAAATFSTAARAEHVGFSVSIGGPGYEFTVGNAPYYRHYPRYYAPYYPAYVAPPVVYAPPPVYVAPRVVYYRAPYVRHPVVVRGPVYYRY
jgi:hypothetical protein